MYTHRRLLSIILAIIILFTISFANATSLSKAPVNVPLWVPAFSILGYEGDQHLSINIDSSEDRVTLYYKPNSNTQYVRLDYEGYTADYHLTETATINIYNISDTKNAFNEYTVTLIGFTEPISNLYLTSCDANGNALSGKSKATVVYRTDLIEQAQSNKNSCLTNEEYINLLKSIPSNSNPMDNSKIYNTVYLALCSSGMHNNEATSICDMVYRAPDLYRDLYLYSLFTYNLDRNWIPSDSENAVSHFSPLKEDTSGPYTFANTNTRYSLDNTVYIISDTSSTELTGSTYFHEVGHAIDFNETLLNYYSKSPELFVLMQEDATEYIYTVIDSLFLSVTLTENDKQNIARFLLGNDAGYPIWDDVTNEWNIESKPLDDVHVVFIAGQTLAWVNALSRDTKADNNTRNAYMVTDCLGGMMNNIQTTVMDLSSAIYMLTHSEFISGHFQSSYWYNPDGSPTMAQNSEAWAEFFAAQMTQNKDALDMNQLYFPRTCLYLDNIARDILKNLKEQY